VILWILDEENATYKRKNMDDLHLQEKFISEINIHNNLILKYVIYILIIVTNLNDLYQEIIFAAMEVLSKFQGQIQL